MYFRRFSVHLVEMRRTGQEFFLEELLQIKGHFFGRKPQSLKISLFEIPPPHPVFAGGNLSHIRSLVRGIERRAAVITAAAEPSGHWTVKSRRVFHRL